MRIQGSFPRTNQHELNNLAKESANQIALNPPTAEVTKIIVPTVSKENLSCDSQSILYISGNKLQLQQQMTQSRKELLKN